MSLVLWVPGFSTVEEEKKSSRDIMTSSIVAVLHVTALLLMCVGGVFTSRSKFKAAVYGHAVILPEDPTKVVTRAEAVLNMNKNLDVYREQARKAREQDAEIIVFPEDGLYGFRFKRESIYPYLEYIPDPRVVSWSPCDDPRRHHDTEVQMSLSCMAKENSIYVVANMGDKQACDVLTDPKCPSDGRYQFNTNVAFGPDGTLLARYHKYHLFYELQFDTPELELIHFDTPFGRFGLMVCFDVLFYDPGIPLILNLNISNIVFPTAWMDALPLLSALGFHSSFARGLGVNFLSANIHLPDYRFHGSGIYGPDGAEISYYGAKSTSKPKLLVAEVNSLGNPKPNLNLSASFPFSNRLGELRDSTETCDSESDEFNLKRYFKMPNINDTFESVLFGDVFTFVSLDKPSGHLAVCQKNVCCDLQYSIDEQSFGRELFAFGAFDGLHTYEGQYYFQICTLVRCAAADNRTTCGSVTSTSETNFLHLSMSAEMQTDFIYPQIVLSNNDGELQLAEPQSWDFSDGYLSTKKGFNKTLLSAALFGRYYSRDGCISQEQTDSVEIKVKLGNDGSSSILSFPWILCISILECVLIFK
ncbi:Pantetheinase [Bulinus truncatus]|nr:Pantetheinase [Bulinus truncatus]